MSEVESRLWYVKPRRYIFLILHRNAFSKHIVGQVVQLLLEITRQNSVIHLKSVTSPSSFFTMKKISVAAATVLNVKFAWEQQ